MTGVHAPFWHDLGFAWASGSTARVTLFKVLRSLGFVMLWMGALAAAMAVAWAGVNLVDDELVQPSPAATATANFRLGTDADELAAIPFATQDMAVPGTASTRAVSCASF